MTKAFALLVVAFTITEVFGKSIEKTEIKSVLDALIQNVNELEKDFAQLKIASDETQKDAVHETISENKVNVDFGVKSDIRRSEFDPDDPTGSANAKRVAYLNVKWPDTNGDGVIEIPYYLDPSLPSTHVPVIQTAIQYINNITCASGPKWIPRGSAKDSTDHYVKFIYSDGCWSFIGKSGESGCSGCQRISIGQGCQYKGIVSHEMCHAMGFDHMQNRPDRDSYVIVHLENVDAGNANNFEKMDYSDWDNQGVPYDYGSVMHYGAYDFSINNKPVITKLDGSTTGLGQRVGLSDIDITELLRYYKCANTSTTTTTQTPTTTTKTTQTPATTTTTATTTKTTPTPATTQGPTTTVQQCTGNSCIRNSILLIGQCLYSLNNKYQLCMQSDGNLAIYCIKGANRIPIASTNTAGKSVKNGLYFQSDGNVVLYTSANIVIWNLGTANTEAHRLTMEDNGNLNIYGYYNTVVWSSKSSGKC